MPLTCSEIQEELGRVRVQTILTPPFARQVIQSSIGHCEVPSNFALNSSIISSNRAVPSSSRRIDGSCRSYLIMAFDTVKNIGMDDSLRREVFYPTSAVSWRSKGSLADSNSSAFQIHAQRLKSASRPRRPREKRAETEIEGKHTWLGLPPQLHNIVIPCKHKQVWMTVFAEKFSITHQQCPGAQRASR